MSKASSSGQVLPATTQVFAPLNFAIKPRLLSVFNWFPTRSNRVSPETLQRVYPIEFSNSLDSISCVKIWSNVKSNFLNQLP